MRRQSVHCVLILSILLFQACASAPVPEDPPFTAEVVSTPPGLEVTLDGKVIGKAPLDVPLRSFDDAVGFSTTQDAPPVIERRVTILGQDRIRVSIVLGDTPSPLAQKLGLSRVVVFDYGANTTFDSSKAELKPDFLPLLDGQAETLKSFFDGVDIYLCGHTDSTGSEDTNRLLSVQRAQAVADHLIAHGLPKDRILVQGFGSDFPIADNRTADGRAQNRRTEIVLPD